MSDFSILATEVKGLNQRIDDFIVYTKETNVSQNSKISETLAEVKRINGSVADMQLRVHDIEYIQANCPAVDLRKDYETTQDEMRFWIFLGKYWKAIALFIGIVIGTYSAITTIASNIKEDRVMQIIESVKSPISNERKNEDTDAQ